MFDTTPAPRTHSSTVLDDDSRLRSRAVLPLLLFVSVLTLLVGTACSDSTDPAGSVADVKALELTPDRLVLDDGQSAMVQVALQDGSGKAVTKLPPGSAVQWTATPREIVTVSGSGMVTALRPGTARVKAEFGNLNAWLDVEVRPVVQELLAIQALGLKGAVGKPLDKSVVIRAVDRHRLPVPGVPIDVTIDAGDGAVTSSSAVTGADGEVLLTWTLGTELGLNALSVTSGDLEPLRIWAEGVADAGSSELYLVSGDAQEGQVGSLLPEPLVVQVADAHGNPVAGVAVNWVFANVWADGSTTTQGWETLISDGDGYVSVQWVLGPSVGDHLATATLVGGVAAGAAGSSGAAAAAAGGGGRVKFNARAKPGDPWRMLITPENASVAEGATIQMTATVIDKYRNPVPNQSVAWKSRHPNIVSVDQNGLVTGLAVGSGGIKAYTADVSTNSTVDVVGQAVGSIAKAGGDGQSGTVAQPLASPLVVRVLDTSGGPLGGVTVSWAVSAGNGSVSSAAATTDSQGNASVGLTLGQKAGSNGVTATVSGAGSVTFNATGVAGPVTSVAVAPSYAQLNAGETADLTATARDQFGNAVSGAAFQWSSSAPAVATVSQSGVVTGVAGGNARIDASTAGATGSASVQVGGVLPLAAPATIDLSLGQVIASADMIEVVAAWAAVSGAQQYGWRFEGGTMSPSLNGATTATSRTIEARQRYADYDATVCAWGERGTEIGPEKCGTIRIPQRSANPPTITGLRVNPGSASVAPGAGSQFSAVAVMSDGSQTAVSAAWSATGGSITSGGAYTAPSSAGNYEVVAVEASSGYADTAAVTVSGSAPPAPTLNQVQITPTSVTLDQGEVEQFIASGVMSDGSTVSNLPVTWSATGGSISSAGSYTAGSTAGTFQVRATDGGSGLSATATVTISTSSSPPPVVLSSITVAPGSVALNPGGAQQFTATGTMSDGSTRSGLAVQWTAGGGSITSSGIYTAGSTAGSYTVTATDAATGISGNGSITVNSVAPPPPPPPPGSYSTIGGADFSAMTLTDVQNLHMFFHESGSDAFDPNPSHGNGPSLKMVPDAVFGQALRMKQDPNQGWWTVKGRYSIPHTDIVWYRTIVRWEQGYFGPRPPNHKLMFFDWAAGGGSQRIERSTGSFQISASQTLVPFGTAVPIHNVGSFAWAPGHEFEPIFDDGEWYEFVMYYGKVGPTEVKTGTFIRRLTTGHVVNPGPWQVKTNHYPSTSGTPLPVRSVSLGENINAAPPDVKFLYYASFEVVDGGKYPNPYGLAGYLQ